MATSNIDNIYDRFLNANYGAAAVVKPYHDDHIARYIKGDATTRLVIKVHGSVDNVGNTVFTREEYANSRCKYPQFYDLLSSLVLTQTFIFIGYSLADPDINLILEENSRKFKSPRPHYLLTPDRISADMVAMFEQNYSIKILSYNSRSDHVNLVDSISDLASRSQAERSKMASGLIW